MNITLPEPLEARLTPSQAALHLAIGLFAAEEVTLGQAAEAAGVSQGEFMRELGRRKIPLHYGVEDFAQDLVTIEKLRGR
jgi:predicted HTH domain antitoxin